MIDWEYFLETFDFFEAEDGIIGINLYSLPKENDSEDHEEEDSETEKDDSNENN